MPYIDAKLKGNHLDGDTIEVPHDMQVIRTSWTEKFIDEHGDEQTALRVVKYYRTKEVTEQGQVVFVNRDTQTTEQGLIDPNLMPNNVVLDERPEIAAQQQAILDQRKKQNEENEANALKLKEIQGS